MFGFLCKMFIKYIDDFFIVVYPSSTILGYLSRRFERDKNPFRGLNVAHSTDCITKLGFPFIRVVLVAGRTGFTGSRNTEHYGFSSYPLNPLHQT